jgi:TolB-like protein/DNA-binding SARP family transcriptional activator/Flp pilus assembly protein TadD
MGTADFACICSVRWRRSTAPGRRCARKTRALVAILALSAPEPLPRSHLTALLWSTRGHEQARASLRQALHELQEMRLPLLSANRNQVRLRDQGLWVDALEITRASVAKPALLDLWRGALLDDLRGVDPGFESWLETERARLLGVVRGRAEAIMRAQQAPEDILATAERLVAVDPLHEQAWCRIIDIHLEHGRRDAAQAALNRCRDGFTRFCGRAAPAAITARLDRAGLPNTAGAPRIVASPTPPGALERTEGSIRLGVMPLRSLDGMRDDPLSLGLAEEITTALSRFRWISCVASTSLAAVAREPHDGTLWERLDLDLLLEGTVQRSGTRVRISSRVLDMRENGAVVWAGRFDREMTDILQLQDEIAAETVAQIDPELLMREGARVNSRPPPTDPTAYELMLRAIPAVYRLERDSFHAAGAMLREAIAIDPTHAASHAWLAYWLLLLVGQGWSADPLGATEQAGILAARAVTLDPSDARGLTLSGHVRAFLGRRPQEGIALHRRALSLNANLPMAWAFLGLAQTYVGQHEDAIRSIGQAHRLSPFDPHGFFFDMALIMPHLLRHDHETALLYGRRAVQLNPGFSSSYKGTLAVLGHLGFSAEAAELRERLMQLEPKLTLDNAVNRSPIGRAADLRHYAEGLRLAGLT